MTDGGWPFKKWKWPWGKGGDDSDSGDEADEPPDLTIEGFSKGADKISRKAYWAARRNGMRKRCARKAARAAAQVADEMARSDPAIAAALAAGAVSRPHTTRAAAPFLQPRSHR